MSPSDRTIRNVFIYVSPKLATYALNLLVLPILTRLLTPEDFGVVALAWLFPTIAVSVVTGGLAFAVPRFYFEYRSDPKRLSALIFASQLFLLVVLVVSAVAVWAFREPLAQLTMNDTVYGDALFVAYLAAFFEQVVLMYLRLYQNMQRAVAHSAYVVIRSIIQVAVGVTLVWAFDFDYTGLLLGYLAGSLTTTVLLTGGFLRDGVFAIRLHDLRDNLAYGLQLVPKSFTGAINRFFDKFTLNTMLSMSVVGVYAIGQQLAGTITYLISTVWMAFSPEVLSDMFDRHEEASIDVGRLFTVFAHVCILPVAFLALFAEEIVTLVAPASYNDAVEVLVVLALAAGAHVFNVFVGSQFAYSKRPVWVTGVAFTSAGVNIVANLLLIPWLGLLGAAAASVLTQVASSVALVFIGQRQYRVTYQWVAVVRLLAVLVTVVVSVVVLRRVDAPALITYAVKAGLLVVLLVAARRAGFLSKAAWQRLVDAMAHRGETPDAVADDSDDAPIPAEEEPDVSVESLAAHGGPDFPHLVEAARDITFDAVDDLVEDSPIVEALSRRFDRRRIVQSLHKALGPAVFEATARIEMSRASSGSGTLTLPRTPASPQLRAFAEDRGVVVRFRGSPFAALPLGAAWRRVTSRFSRRAQTPAVADVPPTPDSRLVPETDKPYIAYWIAGRLVSFDPADRTDLFWLIDTPTDPENVLAYFTRADAPPADGVGETLASGGMKALSLGTGTSNDSSIPRWRSGAIAVRTGRELRRIVLRSVLASALRFKRGTTLLAAYALDYAGAYAYWRDFFESNDVKVSVSQYDFTRPYMAKNQAIADLGGVSVSYQYSNLDFSSAEMSMSADVLFGLGPRYKQEYRDNRSTIDTFVEVGYVTDNAFGAVRERAEHLRSQLASAGAGYVVAYFDEGSSDADLSPIRSTTAARAYTDLFEWLEEDERLGLIIKPKSPATLRERLGSDATVALDHALATGRCVLLGAKGKIRSTSAYPAEAALASDLSVGLLVSGTSVLESHLAGARAVFLDQQGLDENPAYENHGEGRVVFESIGALRDTFLAWQSNPSSVEGFGDVSVWAADRVRLRDGQAAERMGGYVQHLYDALVAGANREEALAGAAEWYASEWGAEYVERVQGWHE